MQKLRLAGRLAATRILAVDRFRSYAAPVTCRMPFPYGRPKTNSLAINYEFPIGGGQFDGGAVD